MTATEAGKATPALLYKYRRPDIPALRRILVHGELWAARPTSFNDPFDCLPFIDLTGTYDEALAYIDLRLSRNGGSVRRQERRRLAREIQRRGLGAISPLAGDELWRQSVDLFGITSFSEDCLSILMWSHYAENHTGVCLEFGTTEPPMSVVAPVSYFATRPTFRPLDPDRTGLMERILLHKADIWSYEREWRHFRIKEGSGVLPFPSSALKSVLLGAAATPAFEAEVREMLAARREPLPVRRVRFDQRSFRLHVE